MVGSPPSRETTVFRLNDCSQQVREQYRRWNHHTVSIEQALRSRYYRIARPWLDAGYACIPSKGRADKSPGLWNWAHLHSGEGRWTHADLVYCARMIPNANGLVLGGSHVNPAKRIICIDQDNPSDSLTSWIVATF